MHGMRIRAIPGVLGMAALIAAGCNAPAGSVGPASDAGLEANPTVETPSPTIEPTPDPPSQRTPPLAGVAGWFVYQRSGHPNGGVGLWLIRPDGRDDHAIVTDVTDSDPSGQDEYVAADWADDGSTLLFQRHRMPEDRRDLFIYDVASDSSRELIRCDAPCVDVTEAAMAPDGSRIVYFFAEGPLDADGIPAACGLRILDVGSTVTTDLTNSPCGLIEERFPRWSSDGRRIAFVRTHQDVKGGPWTSTELVVHDLEDGRESTVFDPGLDADALDWSPDGETVVIVAGRRLLVVTLSDGASRVLLDLDTADVGFDATFDRLAIPRFTPDGSAVLFGINQDDGAGTAVRRDLWMTGLDGSSAQEVFPDGNDGNERGFYTRASLVASP